MAIELNASLVDEQDAGVSVEKVGTGALLVDMDVRVVDQMEEIEAVLSLIEDAEVAFCERVVAPNVT